MTQYLQASMMRFFFFLLFPFFFLLNFVLFFGECRGGGQVQRDGEINGTKIYDVKDE